MRKKLNASQAGALLGLSPKTLRKRLNAKYKGPLAIRGAVRHGRDWLIPAEEVDRLIQLRDSIDQRSVDTEAAFHHAYLELRRFAESAESGLVVAAENYRDGRGEGAFKELEKALAQYNKVFVIAEFVSGLKIRADVGVSALAQYADVDLAKLNEKSRKEVEREERSTNRATKKGS